MSSILVVDDHPIIAEACRVVLGDVEDVVAARDVPSGYEAFLEHRPDVVILDLSFPGEPLGGVDLLRRIYSDAPLTRVLIFSMHADADIVASAIKAGAIGYLLKDYLAGRTSHGRASGSIGPPLRRRADQAARNTPSCSSQISLGRSADKA